MKSKKLFLCLLAAVFAISSCNVAMADTYTLVGGEVTGKDPIAIGVGSSAENHYDISLGVNAVSNGYAHLSSETPAIAIGYNAEAVRRGVHRYRQRRNGNVGCRYKAKNRQYSYRRWSAGYRQILKSGRRIFHEGRESRGCDWPIR